MNKIIIAAIMALTLSFAVLFYLINSKQTECERLSYFEGMNKTMSWEEYKRSDLLKYGSGYYVNAIS